MMQIIWNPELYHSWGTKPQQKRREKQYNAEYYKKNKWRWYDDIKNGAQKAVDTFKDLYSKDDSSKYKNEIEENLRRAQLKREREEKKLEALERKRDIQQAKEDAERKAEEAAERERLRKLAEEEQKKKEKTKKTSTGSGRKKASGGSGGSKGKGKGSGKGSSKAKSGSTKKAENDKTPKPVDKRGGRNTHKKGRIDTITVSRKMSTIPDVRKANIISPEILKMKIGG